MMIHTQTLALPCDEAELEAIAAALDFLRRKDYASATAVLIARHDVLTAHAELKLYDQREAM